MPHIQSLLSSILVEYGCISQWNRPNIVLIRKDFSGQGSCSPLAPCLLCIWSQLQYFSYNPPCFFTVFFCPSLQALKLQSLFSTYVRPSKRTSGSESPGHLSMGSGLPRAELPRSRALLYAFTAPQAKLLKILENCHGFGAPSCQNDVLKGLRYPLLWLPLQDPSTPFLKCP